MTPSTPADSQPTAGVASALTALPGPALFRVEGADAAAFLDRQLTINVSSLAAGDTAIGCWCDAKGRVVCTLWIQRGETTADGFLLACHHTLRDSVVKRLQMYVLRAAVKVAAVDQLCLAVPSDRASWPSSCWQALTCVQRIDVGTHEDLAQHWAVHEIEAGFVWLDAGTSGVYLPQMLAMSRWQALDFHKGCFPGQEVIARAHYLGRVKRGLYHFAYNPDADSCQLSETAVTDDSGTRIGEVIVAVMVPTDAAQDRLCCGLAILQIDNTFSDTVLSYAGDDVIFTPVNDST